MTGKQPLIVGAGLAGLLAAVAWPNAHVIEMAPFPKARHKALLRFRSDAVSKLTGIEFEKVSVRKGIFSQGSFVEPNARVCNLYSQKVVGQVEDRSIWNIVPAERYIAPEDLYDQLIEAVGDRVEFGIKLDMSLNYDCPIISTVPLTTMLQQCEMPLEQRRSSDNFIHKSIKVERWRVPDCDVYQTIYFPDRDTSLYRASITGDMLIAECVEDWDCKNYDAPFKHISEAFGLDPDTLNPLVSVQQPYGKLVELDEVTRKNALFRLTAEHNVYSLGRFATWRNIMLDDVVNDIAVIKRLMKSGTAYDARREAL